MQKIPNFRFLLLAEFLYDWTSAQVTFLYVTTQSSQDHCAVNL